MALSPGTLLNNRYRIISILGQGGMGSVYQAMDENLSIPVAVKENLFLTDEYARQFQREATILASLRHPSLPRVGDYFTVPGTGQYLIMDYIDGEDLRQRIERQTNLSDEEVILIGTAMCEALTYLHTRRPPIIHRDIKPGNIKITPQGHVALVDFGLAKVMVGSQQTTTGARAMTPGYSPPEQYGTASTDARTDIYSLGATLYASLTGTIPEDALARATGKTELTPVRELMPKVNRRLAAVIEKALSIDPDDRYQTSEDFRKALMEAGSMDRMPEGLVTVAPPPNVTPLSSSNELESEPAFSNSGAMDPMANRRPSRPVPRRKKKSSAVPFTFFAVILLAAIFIVQPEIPTLVRGWIFPPLGTPAGNPGNTPIASLKESPTPQDSDETLVPTGLLDNFTATPTPTEQLTATETPTITPTPSPTLMGGGQGQIAFASNRTGSMQVWLMNVDGGQQKPLTNMPDGACQPDWSPDGQKLVIISPCFTRRDVYEGAKIYILDLAGGGDPVPLPLPPSPAADYDPVWSPDGNRIAFTSTRAGNPDIYVVNLTDSSLIQLTNTRNTEKYPAWSPTGSQISFTRDFAYSQIWVMTDTGQFQSRFSVSGEVNDLWPVWSADGNFILYSQMSGGNVPWLAALRYEDRNTQKSSRIPPRGQGDIGPVAEPAVSPDGNWIIFESWPQGDNHDIYLATINGANKLRLTTDKDFDFGAVWRPQPIPQN